jgi:hypothetical protein
MSEKQIRPWKFGEGANLVAIALRDHGPMTAAEIKVALRSYGQPRVKIAYINRLLQSDLKGAVECREGKWHFVGDPDFV